MGLAGEMYPRHNRAVSSSEQPTPKSDAYWRDYLSHGDPRERSLRRVLKMVPAERRCHLCAAPFAGAAAPVMRLLGKRPSDMHPNWCTSCFDYMSTHHGGAEIECTMLFADIRGSTALGESMSPAEFRGLMDRFYGVSAEQVFAHDGMVDKFVGDELVAMFLPLLAGEQHAARAVETARAILVATGHDGPGVPWAPVGAGIQTGVAWVGAVGNEARTELTALGDAVNTAARLAAAAGTGEILVSEKTATAAGLGAGLARRQLELRGKSAPTDVLVLQVGAR